MARPYASMYLHPWDVVDEGPRRVLERVKSAGIRAVNLATSYHSGRYILPHNPKRKTHFAEEGVVYFQPNLSLYKGTILKPRRSTEFKNVDVLDLLMDSAPDYNIKVNSWTVTFHNSAFAKANPELAIKDAFDGTNYNYLCPNNPHARNYQRGLIKNLAEYKLNAIMLEASCYPASLSHGDHHEMFGTQVEPLPSELMTVCFCQHCVKRARKSGLDLLRTRKLVRDVINASFEMPTNVLRNTPFAETIRTSYVLATDLKQISDVIKFQREVVDEVFREARSALKETRSKSKLHVIAFGGFSGEYSFGRGSEGMNLHSLSKIVDGVDLVAYVTEPDLLYYIVRWVKFEIGECPLYVALRPSYPTLFTPEGIASEIRYAMEAGASGVAFYNYGWTPLRNFRWIRKGLESAGASEL